MVEKVHNTKLPVPHIEHPKDSEQYPLRISFLDQQTVQTAHVVFMTQLSYKFENWQGMRPYTSTAFLAHANRGQIVNNSKSFYYAPS